MRERRDRVPVARLSQRPAAERSAEPWFDLAVFEDGLVVYAGHRCVKRQGLVTNRLTAAQISSVRALIAGSCATTSTVPEDEVCIERGTVREVTCTGDKSAHSATDRCRRDPAADQQLARFAQELVERADATIWIGRPAEWTACGPAGKGSASIDWAGSVHPGPAFPRHE